MGKILIVAGIPFCLARPESTRPGPTANTASGQFPQQAPAAREDQLSRGVVVGNHHPYLNITATDAAFTADGVFHALPTTNLAPLVSFAARNNAPA